MRTMNEDPGISGRPPNSLAALWDIGRWKWVGAAIVLVLALAFVWQSWLARPYVSYLTADTFREIALSDGSSVTLAPHSKLIVSSDEETFAITGAAWFDIRHREGRELAISAGSIQVRDIGTKFDIQVEPGSIRVGVAQGRVEISSVALAEPLRLEAGRHLLFDVEAKSVTLSGTPVEAVGAWRSGRLTYDSEPLSLVAADLSRYAGVKIRLPDSLKDRRFSGTLASADGEAALREVALRMGLELVPEGDTYRLESGPA